MNIGVVLLYRLCYGLEEHRLSGPGSGNYHASLPHSYGGHESHDPGGVVFLVIFKVDRVRRIIRYEVVK